MGGGERLRDGDGEMSKTEVLEMLEKSERRHRDAGNGGVAHEFACIAAKIIRDDTAITWRQARVNGSVGVHVLDNGCHVASASL
jgi:hypothetical protein